MISVQGLTKRYGGTLAVDDLTFEVQPGKVTGFLGSNGAGKSTTMRMALGLDRPGAGRVLIAGRSFSSLTRPLREVGALLDPTAIHPGRTGRDHLRVAARTSGIPRQRVEDVLGQVGLTKVAGRRVGGYSLGMRQRLGIACAMLGDPGVLLLDEPVNGLDVDGVRWIRGLLRGFAEEGRTVLVSSHLLPEVQQTADRLVVIRRGRLVADMATDALLNGLAHSRVTVRTPRVDELAARLRECGLRVRQVDGHELQVEGGSAPDVGRLAHAWQVPLHHLSDTTQNLEEAYLSLTGTEAEPRSGAATSASASTDGSS